MIFKKKGYEKIVFGEIAFFFIFKSIIPLNITKQDFFIPLNVFPMYVIRGKESK